MTNDPKTGGAKAAAIRAAGKELVAAVREELRAMTSVVRSQTPRAEERPNPFDPTCVICKARGPHFGMCVPVDDEAKPSEPVAEVSDEEPDNDELNERCDAVAREIAYAAGGHAREMKAIDALRAFFTFGRASLAAENERLRAELAEREGQIAALEELLAVEQGIKDGRPPCTCGGEEPAFCDGCQDWCLVCRGDAMNGCDGCGGTGNGRDQRRIAALAAALRPGGNP